MIYILTYLSCTLPGSNQRKEGRGAFASQFEGTVLWGGEGWWQEPEAAGHIASTVGKQREVSV